MANVNLTLPAEVGSPQRTFPCPICGTQLDLRKSRSQKPYCICNACGVQLFFRGKKGIARLDKLMNERDRLVGAPIAAASVALHAFDRLEQLRAQKKTLEKRRRFLVADEDLENAICAMDRQIARVRAVLDQLAGNSKT